MISRGLRAAWLIFAAANGGLAVAGGAYASHRLALVGGDHAVELFRLAGQYQMSHALALVAVVLLAGQMAGRGAGWALRLAGWCFVAGTVLFCGALYLLALVGPTPLSPAAPIGGTAFLVGWGALATAAGLWSAGSGE